MAVVMILQVFVITPTYAEDTRTKISNIEATSDTDSIPVYGGQVKNPTFNMIEGAPARFDVYSGIWKKKDGETWNTYNGETFTEGTYKYKVQIRVDKEAGKTHVLDSNGITVTVDGSKWADEIAYVFDTYSYVWATSKEYEITAPVGTPLNFAKDNSWDIGLNYKGRAIDQFSVANGAVGGEKPYTFSKVSGPNWIRVASDGTVSGTPNSIGKIKTLLYALLIKLQLRKK